MKVLDEYNIPFHGLPQGEHVYTFSVTGAFFEAIGTNLFSEADLQLEVRMHSGGSMLTFDMQAQGTLHVECDRCTNELPYPIEGKTRGFFVVKTNSTGETNRDADDMEIVHLPPGVSSINIAQQVLEFINSLVPQVKVPCEITGDTSVCNKEVLQKLSGISAAEAQQESSDPRWLALQNLKQNKN